MRECEAGERQHFLRGGRGADAHDAGGHTGRSHADDAGAWGEPVFLCGLFVRNEHCAGSVVDAAGVPGGHAAFRFDGPFEFGQRFQAGLTRVFVFVDDNRVTLLLRDGDGRNLCVKKAGFLGSDGFELRGQRHLVLVFAADLVVGGHVFCRFGHGVHTVFFFHQLVDKTPADGGVKNLRAAAEGALGLGHDKRRAAHALYAAGDHHCGFPSLDGARCRPDSVHARTAQAVDGGARRFKRQPGQQAGHARHVAVVFAGLIHTAIDDVGHRQPVDIGIARHQRLERDGAEVVGAHAGERATVAAEWGADGVANEGLMLGHGVFLVES